MQRHACLEHLEKKVKIIWNTNAFTISCFISKKFYLIDCSNHCKGYFFRASTCKYATKYLDTQNANSNKSRGPNTWQIFWTKLPSFLLKYAFIFPISKIPHSLMNLYLNYSQCQHFVFQRAIRVIISEWILMKWFWDNKMIENVC